jgi:hypothetical protein
MARHRKHVALRGLPREVDIEKRTQLPVEAPAPQINAMIADKGPEATAEALTAWDARLAGKPIHGIAHEMGLSVEAARALIKEAHAAIAEDLKANLDLNRQLDLGRIDGLIRTYYPLACAGDQDCALVTLKCIAQRSKLIGLEPAADPNTKFNQPQNVLVWIQNQLPSINRIVDSLPLELAPGAPS